MSSEDYIPREEEDFNDFQDEFEALLVTDGPGWGVPAGTITDVTNAKTDWTPKYAAGRDEADPTSAQRKAKNDSRKAYTTLIRSVVNQYLKNNPAVTNDERIALGITVPDTTRTRVPVPDHAPKHAIDKIDHLFHKLRITDPANPTSRKKPEGVARINVYRYIGEQSASPQLSEYSFLGASTKFLYTSSFEDTLIGKKAWYITQYENTRGERGPVSTAVSATIA
jgi:hypothetical protein